MQIQIRETPHRPVAQPLTFEAHRVELALDRFQHRIADVEVRVRRGGRPVRADVQVRVHLLDGRTVDASARGDGLVASVINRAIVRARDRLEAVPTTGWGRRRSA